MRQPDAGAARGFGASSRSRPQDAGERTAPRARRPADDEDDRPRLPPGQHVQAAMPVMHYGPVPVFNPDNWDLQVYGATAAGLAEGLGLGRVR